MPIRFLFILLLISQALCAQKKPVAKPTRILFVFDASKSMNSKHGNLSRMDGAKDLFFRFIDSLSRDKTMQFALRMYGHTVKYPPGDCRDSKLVVPFSAGNKELIKQKVREARPTGITPIEHSLTEAANDFNDNKTNNIVILITDGIEECGGDPCKSRQKLMTKGIIFKPFIIGIGLSPEQIKTFECVGTFLDYDTDEVFTTITEIIKKQKLSKTTVQVNLLDSKQQAKETNVNMTFIDLNNDAYKYNYIHTLNMRDLPDTMYLDDYPPYKVIAHTIPPVESAEVKILPGKHNTITMDAPQGFLHVKRNSGAYNFNEKVKCVVRQKNTMNTLNVQPMNSTEKYITGDYELEILTLPRILVSGAKIEQSKTYTVNIANAGVLQLKCLEPGDGCVLVQRPDQLEWVCNLGTQSQQTFYLQPGNYVVTWRARSLKGSIYTVEKKFTIVSDMQTTVELYK